MRSICVINPKGGVGKTTTAINLAAGLSRNGKKVLLIDLDPQGNVDISLRIQSEHDLYDLLTGTIAMNQCISHVAANFDVISSKGSLEHVEEYLNQHVNGKILLKEKFKELSGYHYIIIDCAPSLGVLSQNALAFCQEAFVPTATDYLGFMSLLRMAECIDNLNKKHNYDIRITKIIPTLYDKRNKICKETISDIQTEFPELTTYAIRNNSKLKEAPKHGQSIFSYAKSSPGARDYAKLVEDVLMMEATAKVR